MNFEHAMDCHNVFASSQPYLQSAGVSGESRRVLLDISYGRAVLVAEAIQQIGAHRLASRLNEETAVLSAIHASIWRDLHQSHQWSDRKRYSPPLVSAAHQNAQDTFHQKVVASRPTGWSWAELAASGSPISAACLAGIARDVFEESQQLLALNEDLPWRAPRAKRMSFAERCALSGCPFLAPRVAADEAMFGYAPTFDEPPAKRLRRSAGFGRADQDPRHVSWRFQGHLEAELQIRMSVRSFARSWKSYGSGWHAWHHFMESYHPLDAHFPLTLPRLAAFASHFRNESSLSTYIAWIRSGQNVLGIDDGLCRRLSDALMRGIKASWVPRPKSVIRRGDVEKLVARALRDNKVNYARAFAICYHFTLRAQSEAFDLTLDGIREGRRGWHSKVVLERGGAVIHFERRKNERCESQVKRRCCCSSSRAVCGPCALLGSIRDAIARSGSRQRAGRVRLLGLGCNSHARTVLRDIAAAVGVDQASWHGFRRGSATDLVAKGASLTQVLSAGAWRSAAFLRYIAAQAIAKRQALDFSFNDSDSE